MGTNKAQNTKSVHGQRPTALTAIGTEKTGNFPTKRKGTTFI